jgi:hypothetical protein
VIFLGHALLFFLAAFTGFLMKADRDSLLCISLMIAVPVAGVYFLGWWAVLTFILGAIYGGKVFGESIKGGRNRAED